MNPDFKKYVVLSVIILTAIGLFAVTRAVLEEWHDAKLDALHDQKIEEISSFSRLPDTNDFYGIADGLRTFVHGNSQHKMDDEFYAHWPDRMKLTDAFLDGLKGNRKDLPHMECSTRSNLLSALYEANGLNTRNVVLYTPEGNLKNHRLIEVQDPETGAWHAQDATHNTHWRDKTTKQRASFLDIVAAPDKYEPCTGGTCGWHRRTADGSVLADLKHYLHIATVHDKETDLRVTLYSDAAPPERRYSMDGRTGTFCDFFAKNCVDYRNATP